MGQHVLWLAWCSMCWRTVWVSRHLLPLGMAQNKRHACRVLSSQVYLGVELAVFHKICKNFTFIPLSTLFEYVLWVKKTLGATEVWRRYSIYLHFLEKLRLKNPNMVPVITLSIKLWHISSYSGLIKYLGCCASDINKYAVDLKHADN